MKHAKSTKTVTPNNLTSDQTSPRRLDDTELAEARGGGGPRPRLRSDDDGPFPVGTCLSEDARIATPNGDVRAADIREDMVVWSQDAAGHRIAAAVARINATPVARSHTLVRIVLSDGRAVTGSAGHPTAHGTLMGAVLVGDQLDGAQVISVERIGYGRSRTVDLLPASSTGVYWADGVALGSTLGGTALTGRDAGAQIAAAELRAADAQVVGGR